VKNCIECVAAAVLPSCCLSFDRKRALAVFAKPLGGLFRLREPGSRMAIVVRCLHADDELARPAAGVVLWSTACCGWTLLGAAAPGGE
jgi:hypothetical protein